jgi:hypothetical protein
LHLGQLGHAITLPVGWAKSAPGGTGIERDWPQRNEEQAHEEQGGVGDRLAGD